LRPSYVAELRAHQLHRSCGPPVRSYAVGDSPPRRYREFHHLRVPQSPRVWTRNRAGRHRPHQSDRVATGNVPPLINDSNHRVYRGNDPRANPSVQDRVENVAFNDAGRFLVMCGVLPHFFDNASGEFVMFGFVDVNGD
jgi:hypothetical protein